MEDVFQPRDTIYNNSSFLLAQNLPLDLIVTVFVSGTKLLYIYNNLKFLKFEEESLDFPYLEIYFTYTLAI